MHGFELAINAFLGGLILIAIFAVLVRPGSQTVGVLNASGSAIGTSLYAAQGIHA